MLIQLVIVQLYDVSTERNPNPTFPRYTCVQQHFKPPKFCLLDLVYLETGGSLVQIKIMFELS